ncbi:MAG: hypothetical protein QNJ57_12215 [Flavobacteriaceae bacterium]|nr:hypothetical protein [Flavobacteriaceae bacterium]
MDQLDLLKKDWKKQEEALPKYSFDELSQLIHKKSSSIVKWIFIISVLELVLPHLVYLFVDYDTSMQHYKELGIGNFITGFYIIFYIVIFYFIFRFYKNYQSISANSKPKELMQNIIKTRRTVKHYIWFNLAMVPLVSIVILHSTFKSEEFLNQLPENFNMAIIWVISIVVIVIITLLLWLFYRLIYGILLNKLKRNYNELMSNGNEVLQNV